MGRHSAARRTSGATKFALATLIAGGVLAYPAYGVLSTYHQVDSNLTREEKHVHAVSETRPVQLASDDDGKPLDILVIGSDKRPSEEGFGRSDTNILVHVSADRENVTLISIPRDSMVAAPVDCNDPLGPTVVRQWNENYSLGGARCTATTVERATGVRVDHFVVVDFNGFADIVDALGGVTVKVPQAIHDKDAHLDVEAGTQRLNGDQALGYVRARKSIGDGSDLGRIKRQQAFLKGLAQELRNKDSLADSGSVLNLLRVSSQYMTVDNEWSVSDMASLAADVKGAKIKALTVPNKTYAPDPNRVEWTPESSTVWRAVQNDTAIPGAR